MSALTSHIAAAKQLQTRAITGTVATVRGLCVFVDDLPVSIGTRVKLIHSNGCDREIHGEVIGFNHGQSIVMTFDQLQGISPGTRVIGEQHEQSIPAHSSYIGRVIDGLCRPLDDGEMLLKGTHRPLCPPPTPALTRRKITDQMTTGVRAIDGFITVGVGQRVGIVSESGIGKSTLLSIIARNSSADVNVVGLVGERGREVREFIDHTLGPNGLRRSIVVVATGDQSPLLRVRAAMTACTIAEYFRDQGADVMLMLDSLTRLAHAQRQIGLSVGEQPVMRGYTPSVITLLSSIVERAGAIERAGSITGLYSILIEGNDQSDPIAEAARGLLDGHVALSPELAAKGHYPAVDVLHSISRVADSVCDQRHIKARQRLIQLIAAFETSEELINIGAYTNGSNAVWDAAIAMKPRLDEFMRQKSIENVKFATTYHQLLELSSLADRELGKRPVRKHKLPAAM